MAAVLAEVPWCAPRFATPRSNRRTLGPAVGKAAAMLGTPLMPWQQYVADVALEVDEDGQLAYREIVLTVPRQSGKTTLLLAIAVHRALAVSQFGRRNRIVYTAQTRKDAREKLEEDFVLGGLEPAKRLRGKWRFVQTNGREHVRFIDSGAKLAIDAGTEKAGHGPTLDLAFIDEAFAQIDGRLEQAFGPAMITRTQAQKWINSTAGWLGGSPYLWAKVEGGRARCESGEHGTTAYFEWACAPDVDPLDPATWWTFMPALGHTITERAIRSELESAKDSPEGINGFLRPYANLWVPKNAPAEQVIPSHLWDAGVDRSSRPSGRLVFAFDMNPERSRGAIGVAGLSGGRPHVEVTDDRPGTGWMVDRIVALNGLGSCSWTVDARSPAMSLLPALKANGIEPDVTNASEMGMACGSFYDLATRKDGHPGLVHLGQPELAAALAGAKKRSIGDAFGWDRRGDANIAPLVAVTLAAYGLSVAEKVLPLQVPRRIR